MNKETSAVHKRTSASAAGEAPAVIKAVTKTEKQRMKEWLAKRETGYVSGWRRRKPFVFGKKARTT